jgi:hypothetical protein
MKHLNLELEKLEQRIAPGRINCGGGGSKGSKHGSKGSKHGSKGSQQHHSSKGSKGSKG